MKLKFIAVLTMALMMLAACGGKSDADIQKAAQEKLTADGVAGATVAVKDGVATLTGEVADITVKNKAEASVKVEGVTSVVNNLTTKPVPVATPAAGDSALKGKFEENLRKAGCDGATVEIKDGVATLGGSVADAKFAECVKVAQESGAVKMENKLERKK